MSQHLPGRSRMSLHWPNQYYFHSLSVQEYVRGLLSFLLWVVFKRLLQNFSWPRDSTHSQWSFFVLPGAGSERTGDRFSVGHANRKLILRESLKLVIVRQWAKRYLHTEERASGSLHRRRGLGQTLGQEWRGGKAGSSLPRPRAPRAGHAEVKASPDPATFKSPITHQAL